MPADLLWELGSEELPASFVEPALKEIHEAVIQKLKEAQLPHGESRVFGTPRRLALWVRDVAEKSPDVTKEVMGPSARAAFDKDGKPTVAAMKFAEGQKVPVESLRKISTPKGEYLAVTVEEKGQRAIEILSRVLNDVVHHLHFKKSMRWGDVDMAYGRPLHWMVALYGTEVIPVIYGDVKSGRETRGHRFLAPEKISVNQPETYEALMEKAHVLADVSKRRALVERRIQETAAKVGAHVLKDDALLDQVTQLVEWPAPVLGQFDEQHLDLPPEVLVQEMKSHQRYFSLVDAKGKLLPKFIAVSNTPVKDEKLSLKGYERVLRSRLADGRFFFDEDRKVAFAERLEKLQRVVWQGALGSYAEKVVRIRTLAVSLSDSVGHPELKATVDRAAELCKADLVTGMVGEFPELQGVMGREYALASGEKPEVALAIFEHYLPRGATDSLPTAHPGAIVGLADRFDTLCGIFGIGKPPTGAADPFGLRRATLAIVNIVLHQGYRLSLKKTVDASLALLQPKFAAISKKDTKTDVSAQIVDFVRGRLKALWTEQHRADVVEAVLSAGFDDIVDARDRLVALSAKVGSAEFAPLAATFKRVANIVEKQAADVSFGPVNESLLKEAEELALGTELNRLSREVQMQMTSRNYERAVQLMGSIKPFVDSFFEKVMVMAEDKALRDNRVRLLMNISKLFSAIADFSKLSFDA